MLRREFFTLIFGTILAVKSTFASLNLAPDIRVPEASYAVLDELDVAIRDAMKSLGYTKENMAKSPYYFMDDDPRLPYYHTNYANRKKTS